MIKRILALRYVCKKYNLKYCPTFFGDTDWVDPINGVISVNLFQKNFYQTLYHEVGHVVADRSLNFSMKYVKAYLQGSRLMMNNGDAFVRLQEEATASKFAIRMCKVKDKEFLKRAWYTYTSALAGWINSGELDKYVSTVHKYNKYFED